MASKRSAYRFIEPSAKAVSAGLCLALTAAALLAASGCGGGDDSSSAAETASTSTSASADVAAGGDGAVATQAADAGQGRGDSKGATDPSGGQGGSPGGANGTGAKAQGKHGPRIAVPTGEPEPAPTAQQRAQATVADLSLYSPDVPRGSSVPLPTAYTCDGKDSWPRISWQEVPPDTEELALLAMNSQPVKDELFFDWAVAGIDPSLSGLEAGRLPKGAVMGRNSFGHDGYSICPPPQSRETYIFILYAIPEAISPKKGFDPLAFREAALDLSHKAGLMAATYTRG